MGETCSTCQNRNLTLEEIKVEEEVKKEEVEKKGSRSNGRNSQNPINNK